jgi:predicted metalloprotease with PDZ domain
MSTPVRYTITSHDPAAHLFDVTLTVAVPDEGGQVLSLPAWIPGSYMIREFARNIVQIEASCKGKKVPLTKYNKHTWIAEPCDGPLVVSYHVYAWDLSVRTAHLDQTHAFFNGTSVFLCVQGQEDVPHEVDIIRPAGELYSKWRVATALPELKAKRYGFGTYIAANYDELIDHPVEAGNFALATFKAHGIAHDIVITGNVPNLDLPRLSADLQKICEAQIAFFEPRTKQAPMQRYVFMTLAVGDGYGGLEHRASTALICSRSDLPVKRQPEKTEGYRTYLGLCSHEYFHTWNVKRIKPAAFAPYDLNEENYTSLLWLFEGFTSYYDDLFLLRTGLIDTPTYLKMVGKTINGVLRGTGRLKQSVAESSFDAWGKYYRQDENATNAIVSYYTKGSLVALALDLTIRSETGGKKSLDDVMRRLWQTYGKSFYEANGGKGIAEADIEGLFEDITGVNLKRFFQRYIHGTVDLPLQSLLSAVGVTYTTDKNDKPSLGVRLGKEGGNSKIAAVYEGGAAHAAGLSAGDVFVAIDGLRVPVSGPDGLLSRYRKNDQVIIHVFRRDELLAFSVKLHGDTLGQVTLGVDGLADAARKRAAWLRTI